MIRSGRRGWLFAALIMAAGGWAGSTAQPDSVPAAEAATVSRGAAGLPDEGSIGEGDAVALLQIDAASAVWADAGASLTWRREGGSFVLRPESGLVLIRAGRKSVETGGVAVEFGERRFRIYDGIVALDTGEDGLRLGILFQGRTFESGTDGLILERVTAPVVSLGAGGGTLFYRDLRPLIRDDQVRIHRMALNAASLMAGRLEQDRQILASSDLAAMIETLRVLRLRIPQEMRPTFHRVLVAAAQREEFERRHHPFSLPPLLSVPMPVEPWDEVFEW